MKKITKLIIPALTISLLMGCNFDNGATTTVKPGGETTRPHYWDDNIVQIPIKPTGSTGVVDPSTGTSTEPSSSSKPGSSTKPSSGTKKPTSSTTKKPTTSSSTTKPKPTRPSNSAGKLEFTKFGLFTGMTPEGGTDEYVENVVALYVTNISPDYLEHAIIYYEINGQEASFAVEGLRPGKSAWVIERNQMKIEPPYSFVHAGDQSAFQVDNWAETTGLEIKMSSGYMTIENKTGKDLKDVVIRYKELFVDQDNYRGVYSGGIVYNVPVGDIKAGEKIQASAEHCKPTGFEVVRIDWS